MKILYYSHHHGSGHARNASYFHKILQDKLTVVTSSSFTFSKDIDVVKIPDEGETPSDIYAGREMLPSYLHYSPVGNSKIIERSATILKACFERKIDLAIVDLSVEVATLLRAASVPFAYVRLPGNRNDTPHLECYKAATFLLAYYPQALEDESTADWIVEKTIYLDFLSLLNTYDLKENKNNLAERLSKMDENLVMVIKGYGGHEEVDEGVKKLRKKLSGYFISVGPINEDAKEIYDEIIDHSPNVPALMAISSRIVIPPSLNLTAEALFAGKPLTVIPSQRHFDEHEVMAKNLIRCGYADNIDNLRKDFNKYIPTESAKEVMMELRNQPNLKSFLQHYNIKN